MSEGREHQKTEKVDEKGEGKRETEGVRRREESKKKFFLKKKGDSSANQPSSIPLTAAEIQAGRGSLARQKKKK